MKTFDEEVLKTLIRRAQEQARNESIDDTMAYHAAEWLKWVLLKQRKRDERRNKPKKGELTCESCGTVENVSWQEDPYSSDLHDDHTLYPFCDTCVTERAQEL